MGGLPIPIPGGMAGGGGTIGLIIMIVIFLLASGVCTGGSGAGPLAPLDDGEIGGGDSSLSEDCETGADAAPTYPRWDHFRSDVSPDRAPGLSYHH